MIVKETKVYLSEALYDVPIYARLKLSSGTNTLAYFARVATNKEKVFGTLKPVA
jgi:hypothetical protein